MGQLFWAKNFAIFKILRGQFPQCIAANDLSPESPGMTSLVSAVSDIPPAFASIEKRLPTASSGKIFPGIKPLRYGRSNRKTLLEGSRWHWTGVKQRLISQKVVCLSISHRPWFFFFFCNFCILKCEKRMSLQFLLNISNICNNNNNNDDLHLYSAFALGYKALLSIIILLCQEIVTITSPHLGRFASARPIST